jgi:peroxiredoxin
LPVLATLLFAPAPLLAQDTQGEAAAGHSVHGETFDEGPRQKAYLMGGTGDVHLQVTSTNPDVQAFFDQGVGQLHGFWYYEAERSFRQAAALDPACAMAYWGMAMANVNNSKRAKGFIQVAVDKKSQASPRERQWIDAYSALWLGKKDDKERRQALVRALEKINLEFPNELEAKAFLAYHIWDNQSKGWPINSKLAVDMLLRDVFAAAPLHPAHHYIIHLWDEENAVRALGSAARNGPSAPSIAHQWHMPSHTYAKAKRYADALWQQDASARVDHRFMMKDWNMPYQIFNYTHNNQWLVENLEYVGRAHEAVAVAKNLIEVPRHPKFNTLGLKPDGTPQGKNGASSGAGRRRLLETLTRYELWDDVIVLADTVYLEPTDIPAEQVKRLRILGIAHFARKNMDKGFEQINVLEAKTSRLRAERLAAAEEAEAKARKEKKDAVKAMAEAMGKFTDRFNAIDNALAELRGCAALAQGEPAKAKEFFDQVNDIPRDRLARIQCELGNHEQAIKTARAEVASGENQVYRLANLVDVLRRCAKEDEAKKEFAKLRELAADADLDVPVMVRLAPLANELNLAADWRIPRKPAADFGDRPALQTLGPIHWQPWQAPAWKLPSSDGTEVSSSDYRGKPVVCICYLGFGCVHCMEQLNTFGPMAKEFADAGVSLVAISSDSLTDIQKPLVDSKLRNKLAFPILADPGLSFFKAHRAFDDFESKPLHGTFLIDGAGRIRWQDVSFEPFTDARFLLGEAKRLLAISNN